uniref:Uncharacterized protein n=1 Tax=Tanacetum cinerariifolium TaxID=118510 RepID=A0A6L2J0E8_TANCI|nr:hypothetical protein [Tanacetum cinerariifolium]
MEVTMVVSFGGGGTSVVTCGDKDGSGGRYSVKEKVTLANIFYLHSMDGRELVDVPWHVAKFLCDKDIAEIVNDKLDDSGEEANAVEARRAQKENERSQGHG